MAMDSPLRRSGIFSPKTPARRVQQNDDEAERQARRSTAFEGVDDSPTDSANLQHYLQMYTDNKFNKDNAWDVNVIDHFSNMLAKHHKVMTNFQVVGSSLEASAKVYVLRVDSLHTDTMRMASELSRQASKKTATRDALDDEDGGDGVDKENDESTMQNDGLPKPKKKRPARQVATVTKNKETLNSKLDTNPFTDPFFAQLNSIVGDINASNRLMQNMISSKDGELRLRMDYPFWDLKPHPEMIFNDEEKYEDADFHAIPFPCVNDDLADKPFHQRLQGYRITDTPAEDDEEPDIDHDLSNRSVNLSAHQAAAIVFDPNAEVEQVSQENDYVMDYDPDFAGVEHGADFDDLTQEERVAVEACKGLRRMPVIIEDMRPIDSNSSQLEYSYRPLEMISQFWAGPSHWKYRRLRSSVQQKKSLGGSVATTVDAQEPQRKKRAPRRKRFEPTTLEQLLNSETDVFVKKTSHIKNITYSKKYISQKWNQKKLRLPTKLELEKDMFTRLQCAPGLNIAPKEPEEEPEIPVGDYNYDNNLDKEYCRQVNVETDAETETDFGGEPDHINTSDENIPTDMGPVNQTLDIIPTEFAGAPDKIEKILISYAKRAKPVDMKQLKSGCWRLVNEVARSSAAPRDDGVERMDSQSNLSFKEIYKKLPQVLSKSMAENISVGLVFYSMLHLANEKGLQLQMQDNLDDFTIILPE